MARYNVTVELEVEADSLEQAWELVGVPFHNGSIRNDQPHWLNPMVNEPTLIVEVDGALQTFDKAPKV